MLEELRQPGRRILAPPDHLHGDRGCVAERPEHHAATGMMRHRRLGGDADAAPGGDQGQPLVDTGGAAEARRGGLRPQVGGGRAGGGVDGDRLVDEVGEGQRVPGRQGVVRGQTGEPALLAHGRAGQTGLARVRAHDGGVAATLDQSGGRGVAVHELQVGAPVARPRPLHCHGVLAEGCPGIADHQPTVVGRHRLGQPVDGGEHPTSLGEHPVAGRGEVDVPRGAGQQGAAHDGLETLDRSATPTPGTSPARSPRR